MPKPRTKKPPLQLAVSGLAPLLASLSLDEWERGLIEPVLARLFDATNRSAVDTKEVRDGEAR